MEKLKARRRFNHGVEENFSEKIKLKPSSQQAIIRQEFIDDKHRHLEHFVIT